MNALFTTLISVGGGLVLMALLLVLLLRRTQLSLGKPVRIPKETSRETSTNDTAPSTDEAFSNFLRNGVRKTWVGLEIVERSTEDRREVVFGEFPAAYEHGITVGGFADCSAHFEHPSTKGVRARIFGGSNHRFIEILSAPVSSPFFSAIGKSERVDYKPFEFGAFTLRILEVSLDVVIKSLSLRDERFSRAIEHLKPFGPQGRPAVPRLLANLLDAQHSVHSASSEALKMLGVVVALTTRTEVLRRLRECAIDSEIFVRLEAIPVCLELNELETVRERLADSSPYVRILAGRLLWRQTHNAENIVDVLVEALGTVLSNERPSFSQVKDVSVTLGEMKGSARSAIPVLASAMRKQVAPHDAGEALTRIGGEDAARALIKNLDDPSLYTRIATCGALGRLPQHADIIVPALIRRLDGEQNKGVCLWAVKALAEFGAAASAGVSVVRRTRERFARLPIYENPGFLIREADRCLAAITPQSLLSSDSNSSVAGE